MVDWRIYYSDGSTFDSTQGEPEDAPGLGVVCIVQKCPDRGRMVMERWDYYYHRAGASRPWWGADLFGLIDQLTSSPKGTQAVKAGRTVSIEEFQRIHIEAVRDPDFPSMRSDAVRPASSRGKG